MRVLPALRPVRRPGSGGVLHNRQRDPGARDHPPIPRHPPRCRLPRGYDAMRHTELWARLHEALGPAYAAVWADQHVLGSLGERTVNEALASGEQPKAVWRAVWAELELPARER